MRQNITKFFKDFAKSKDGSIAVLTGVTILVIIVVAAISIDLSRLTQSSQKLKNLNDAATLAVAKAENKSLAERTEIFENYMDVGIANSKELIGYEYTLDVAESQFSTVVTASSRSKSELFFSNLTGGEKFVVAESEVVTGKEFIEVSLVLDISTSMAGQKLIELQQSAKGFIETLTNNASIADRISIAIVPFGGTVRLPSELEYLLIPPSTTEHWIDGTWNGCLATEPFDYVTGITPRSRQPFLPDFVVFTDNNTTCPPKGNELVGLSNDPAPLLERIDNFTLSDGTGTDHGMAWGLTTLDPRWRRELSGVNRRSPRGYNSPTQKIIVVMTDGGITGQYAPLDNELTGTLPYQTRHISVPENQTRKGFEDICNLAKSNGIAVYTVSFLINDQDDINTLQSCGTSAGHNFESGLNDLDAVFQAVANSIVDAGLRLSR